MNDIEIILEIVDDIAWYTVIDGGVILAKTTDIRVREAVEQGRIEELVTLLKEESFER